MSCYYCSHVCVCVCVCVCSNHRSVVTQGAIFTEVRSSEVYMPPRTDIEALERPNILYTLYSLVSVQQTNRFAYDGRIFLKQHHFSLKGLVHICDRICKKETTLGQSKHVSTA